MLPRALILLLFLFTVSTAHGQGTLRGFVTDRSNNAALEGANVTLRSEAGVFKGAASNADGFYQITAIVPGDYVLQVSFVGYTTHIDTLQLGDPLILTYNVSLEPGELLDEVVVQQEGGAARLQAGLQQVRSADLARIPTPDPGGDLATYLQTLPGVVSMGDRGGQLFVRGGTPSQNLVLLDGSMIYQPFHIIGFFSAFPQDLISGVDVYAGGFGARYSGRLSSVVDVSMRAGNSTRIEGAGSAGPFLTGVRLEGPLVKGELSLLGSFRTSVIEQTAPTILGQSMPLKFSDLMFKLQQSGRTNNRCSLTGVHTYDRGRVSPDEERTEVFQWSNTVVAGHCAGFSPNSSVFIEANTGFSYVNNEVGDVLRPERSANAWLFNTDVHWTYPFAGSDIQGGFYLQVEGGRYRLAEQFQGIRDFKDYQVGTGLYIGSTLHPASNLEIEPSIALTYPLSYRPSLEPRLRMAWYPGGDEDQTVSAALGIYRQTIEGVSDERDVGSVFTVWLPTPVGNKRARAFHGLLGWQRRLGAFTFSAEGYYKNLRNLPVPVWSVIARFTTSLTLADGEVYGTDVRMEYQRRPLYVYLGYGFSKTTYETRQGNFGEWFGEPIQTYHPPHDRRHQLNVVVALTGKRANASLRWQYGTGLPYTQALGTDSFIRFTNLPDVRQIYGNPRFLFDKPYQARLPAYHRLDLSTSYEFRLPFGALTVQAGALNIYNQENLFYFDLFTFRRVNQLALFPYVSMQVEVK